MPTPCTYKDCYDYSFFFFDVLRCPNGHSHPNLTKVFMGPSHEVVRVCKQNIKITLIAGAISRGTLRFTFVVMTRLFVDLILRQVQLVTI